MGQDQQKAQDAPVAGEPSATTAAEPTATGPAVPPPLPGGRRVQGLPEALLKADAPMASAAAAPPAGDGTRVKPLPEPKPLPEAKVLPDAKPLPDGKPPAQGTSRHELEIDLPQEAGEPKVTDGGDASRPSRRRPAAPSRGRIAANDDAPSIGGLIYALNQKPSNRPFVIASIASAVWAGLSLGATALFVIPELTKGSTFASLLVRPELLTILATLLGPISIFWFLAMMAWRSEELRLRSNAMTEVAVRLAEPDRMAEQSVASLGQTVRRQVSFMNDAVARALGRAGELEALVHNEVAALERSYEENERRIRRLIQELAGERDALLNTSDRVSETMARVGSEVPGLIENLSQQQIKLAGIIDGAGQNLTALETAIAQQAGRLEGTLSDRTQHLHVVLDHYTTGIGEALGSRTQDMEKMLGSHAQGMEELLGRNMEALGSSIASRTENLQLVFEEYARALDGTLANRSQALDMQLVQRTRALDEAFAERLRTFDEAIARSTAVIDTTIGDRTHVLTSALETHAKSLGDTLGRQAIEMDETLMQGISAVRRTSESITKQSIKAIEGLASQADLLKSVSENLLTQVNNVTNRFENQGTSIMRAANALESANHKIDQTLQHRQIELSQTLDRLAGKADDLGNIVQGYSAQLEGSMGEAERRARSLTAELAQGAEERSRATLADIERLRSATASDADRALEDLRSRFANVSREVSTSLGALTNQFGETTQDVRQRAAEASRLLAGEQERIRAQIDSLPQATRDSADAMRRSLQDQLRALEQLSSLANREGLSRDISRPVAPQPARQLMPVANPAPREDQSRALSTLGSALAQEMQARTRGGPSDHGHGQMPPAARPASFEQREGWKLGDLLKRASLDDDQGHGGHGGASREAAAQHQPAAAGSGASLDFAAIARALDPATANAIWGRLGVGQTGIMVRSIYTPEGRAVYDDVVSKFQTDPSVQQDVYRFLQGFEQMLQDAERQDPSGATAQQHLASDYGRGYLLLAHASGRLS